MGLLPVLLVIIFTALLTQVAENIFIRKLLTKKEKEIAKLRSELSRTRSVLYDVHKINFGERRWSLHLN